MLSFPRFSRSDRLIRDHPRSFQSLGDQCPVLIPLPSKVVKKVPPPWRASAWSLAGSHARQKMVVEAGFSLKGGQIMKCVDGKMVEVSWGMFCWLC